jgi:cell division protein FtsZ
MDEMGEITDFLTRCSAKDSLMIWGTGNDESLGDAVSVTVVATDFLNDSFKPIWRGPGNPESDPENDPNSGGGITKVSLGPRGTTPVDDEKPKKPPKPVPDNNGKPYMREVQVATKTEKKWYQPVLNFEPETMEMERIHANTYVKGENISHDEQENIPTIIRNQMMVANHFMGTDNEVSKYTLCTDKEENTVRLRDNNSYIFDVVD